MISLARVFIAAALLGVATISPVKAQTQASFLEAALYFMTDLEPTAQDIVTEDEIVVRYGSMVLVAYTVPSNRCAVRIRKKLEPTLSGVITQFDFCKLTNYQLDSTPGGHVNVTWLGHRTGMCIYKGWDKNENYYGPIDDSNAQCGGNGCSAGAPDYCVLHGSALDLLYLLYGGPLVPQRTHLDAKRMVSAVEYIGYLLTGKPY
jgi:hypothetical protein